MPINLKYLQHPFYVFIFLLFFLPPLDTDLGWHLRYGSHFLETGKILKENTFTYYLSDYLWPNPFPFYEVFIAVLYKIGGLPVLSFATAILMTLTFFIYSRINPKIHLTNFLTFLLTAFFGWHVFSLGMRAQLFSFLGVTTIFLILTSYQKKLKLLFLLPLFFLIWANFHGGFVLGLTLLGLVGIQEFLQKNWRAGIKISGITLVSTAVTLINPYGFKLYQEALHHAGYPLDKLIAEWVPPNVETIVFIVGTVIISTGVILKRQTKFKFLFLSSIILFAYLAIDARRFIPFFWLVVTISLIHTIKEKLSRIEKKVVSQNYLSPILLGLLIGVFVWRVPQTLEVTTSFDKYCTAGKVNQPCKAIGFIKNNPQKGTHVFTAYEWGGFLEWQLPQYRYFVDGRMPAWPTPEKKSPYTVYLEVIQTQSKYQDTLNKYGTDWILIGNGTFLDLELKKGSEIWEEIYRDQGSVIYSKKRAPLRGIAN